MVMFFPELIQSIKKTDRVLEIGPGGTPHPRSDIFLEYKFKSLSLAESQRGYANPLKTSKPVVMYQGEHFPFSNKEFDYVICSHVVEHVENLDQFVSEITRVGKAGYLEYPTIYYDYMYNFDQHLTFVKLNQSKLYWMNKKQTRIADFKPIQDLFYESLINQHFELVDTLKYFFFEGFEWFDGLDTVQTSDLQDLVFNVVNMPPPRKKSLASRLKQKIKNLWHFWLKYT
jgi:SAM-dependent methyltransferase